MKLIFSFSMVVISLSMTGAYAHTYINHAEQSCLNKIAAHCETPHADIKTSSQCFSVHSDENRAHGLMDICEPVDAKDCDQSRHNMNLDGKCRFK